MTVASGNATTMETLPPDFGAWTCPLPLRDYPEILLAHGGGGSLMQDLIQHLFAPAFACPELDDMGDAAVIPSPGARLAMSTDSFVVRPLFFPGSSIGDLAVNGTVNDLAMQGATPLYLSAGFILEEGLSLQVLAGIVDRMAEAARRAGVRIITGDTKVVERGSADQVFINTAGLGVVADGVHLGASRIRQGDAILVSGTLGDHGIAIMSVREGLEFDTVIESDCQPLHHLAEALLRIGGDSVRMMRDATRGGLAGVLQEMASASSLCMELEEAAIPVRDDVRGACELLGLDPLYVANEGKMVAIVAPHRAEPLAALLRSLPGGERACIAGTVSSRAASTVTLRTRMGTHRLLPPALGEQLPRIC
jgi:hydrogenase expression/formation protein HypE